MGVCFVAYCSDCKKKVDLYKNRAPYDLWHLSFATREHGDRDVSFRFLKRHFGHKVSFVSDAPDDGVYGYVMNYEDDE